MPPTELQTFAAQHALDEAGIEITGLSNSERRKVQKILSDAAYNGWTATKTAARIKQVIGLSPRQQNAVNAHRKAQIEAGRTPRQADSSASAYARRLRSARAAVVADYEVRTSLADAQRRVWAQDQHDGKISSRAVRVFKTHKDERTCKTCRPLNGKRQSLRSSKNTPPLHPNCRCTEVLLDEGVVKGAIVYDEKEIVAKVRRVRTMDGVRHYNLPIGSPIVAKPDAPVSFDHIGATWRDDAKMKKARAEFDALPDDAWVTVFHGTTPERAKALVAAGKVSVPKGYKSDLPTKATDALYIAPTVDDAKNYGDAVVEMRVRKRDMKPSPEARNATLATAFFNSFDGAILSSDQTFTAPVVKGIRRVRTVEGARRYGRPIGSPILPGEDGIAVTGRMKPKKPKKPANPFNDLAIEIKDLISEKSDDDDFAEFTIPTNLLDHDALAESFGVESIEVQLSVAANTRNFFHRVSFVDTRYGAVLGTVDWKEGATTTTSSRRKIQALLRANGPHPSRCCIEAGGRPRDGQACKAKTPNKGRTSPMRTTPWSCTRRTSAPGPSGCCRGS
jgi:SPP1 gp7 family putative phage head morphogenesis protein